MISMFQNTQKSHLHAITFFRTLRSIGRKGSAETKLLKGDVVTLDDNVASKFGPAHEFQELNRTLRKMYIEPDDIQNEEELNFGDGYDKDSRNQRLNNKDFARRRLHEIIKKKYFADLAETNLLTHAAKKQIRYLHQLDPIEWSPERLSESFPISVGSVKQLLKSNKELKNKEKIGAHDAEVAKHWENLNSNRNLSTISPFTIALWREGKLLQVFYNGNVNLPQPKEPEHCEIKTKPKKIGEHVAIIQKYLKLKKEQQKKLSGGQTALVTSDLSVNPKERDIRKTIMPDYQISYSNKAEIEDQMSTSYLAMESNSKFEPELTARQYQENLVEEFQNKEHKTSIDDAYLKWLQKQESNSTDKYLPCDTETHVSTIQKTSHDTMEIKTEITDGNNKVGYVYDPESGYKYVIGKNLIRRHIKIPRHLYKENGLYRMGQCFYSHTGEFLYRVPYILND